MKCLVLGGTGFIGSHLCEALRAQNWSVTVGCRPQDSVANIQGILPKVSLVRSDFTQLSLAEMTDLIGGQDCVFHLVSTTTPGNSNQDAEADMRENVLPLIRLLEACRRHPAVKLVYFSSGGTVYGIPQVTPISETHPTNPICSYGIHKLTAEKYIQMYGELYQIPYRILRLANPYGERQDPQRGQGAVTAFLWRALQGLPLEIWGDGRVVRDYVYIQDAIQATLAALAYQGPSRLFNIGNGTGVSLRELITTIEQVLDRTVAVDYQPGRRQDVPVNVLDISRACRELGWRPATTLEQGLRRTLAGWLR